ncbi:SLC13 family permease [Amorphus sp. 3PC139-8]|uniref:SLC13 family permease n=1 Tax=Amorphus sp. 3PC139-8 TaxID=2735676 RepID=UPI00345D7FF0
MPLSLAVSIVVFLLIAVREWLPAGLKIWHVMLGGAVVLLVAGEIGPADALNAINWTVIFYLFAVFSIGAALHCSGASDALATHLARKRSPHLLVGGLVFTFALVAALLTNDAAAIIGTPVAIRLATRAGLDPRRLLVALCVAVTVGSMATPIGNPQNLLIASAGQLEHPFRVFLVWLIVPTFALLALTAWWYGRAIPPAPEVAHAFAHPKALRERTWPALVSAGLLAIVVIGTGLTGSVSETGPLSLGALALLACAPTYLFARHRCALLRAADWPTLVFFLAMFVVTEALIESGSLQLLLGDLRTRLGEPLVAAIVAFVGSQLFSNVPLVDMYLKLAPSLTTPTLMALAAVSTLAGNVFIISAASNVIVVQQAERLGVRPFTFTAFTRTVLPFGLVSTAVTTGWVLAVRTLTE